MPRRLNLLSAGGAVLTGAALWTLAEYSIHRWVMHRPGGGNPMADEHLDHHGNPFRTTELGFDRDNLAWKSAGFVSVAALAWPLTSRRTAALTATGYTLGYVGYTELHHRIHHRAPRSTLARRVWRRHLGHHFSTPKVDFGVSSGVWDRVFGTRGSREAVVRVPRRLAMPWAMTPDGTPDATYGDDYEIVGRARPLDAADLRRALADHTPTVD